MRIENIANHLNKLKPLRKHAHSVKFSNQIDSKKQENTNAHITQRYLGKTSLLEVKNPAKKSQIRLD